MPWTTADKLSDLTLTRHSLRKLIAWQRYMLQPYLNKVGPPQIPEVALEISFEIWWCSHLSFCPWNFACSVLHYLMQRSAPPIVLRALHLKSISHRPHPSSPSSTPRTPASSRPIHQHSKFLHHPVHPSTPRTPDPRHQSRTQVINVMPQPRSSLVTAPVHRNSNLSPSASCCGFISSPLNIGTSHQLDPSSFPS